VLQIWNYYRHKPQPTEKNQNQPTPAFPPAVCASIYPDSEIPGSVLWTREAVWKTTYALDESPTFDSWRSFISSALR
jgi:hypothetical protein